MYFLLLLEGGVIYVLPQSIYNAVGIKPCRFSEYFPLRHKYPSIP